VNNLVGKAFKNYAHIKSVRSAPFSVTLYDLTGRVVARGKTVQRSICSAYWTGCAEKAFLLKIVYEQ
jgi:hypothetical protein